MMLLYHHPSNKFTLPNIISTHQNIYKRTGVDSYMRINLDWPALDLIDSELTATLTMMGVSDHTLLLQCDEGNLVIDCKFVPVQADVTLRCLLFVTRSRKRHSFVLVVI